MDDRVRSTILDHLSGEKLAVFRDVIYIAAIHARDLEGAEARLQEMVQSPDDHNLRDVILARTALSYISSMRDESPYRR